jgi:hypothetical protein
VLEEAVTNRPAVLRQVSREPGRYFATGSPALGWAVAGAAGGQARPALVGRASSSAETSAASAAPLS